MAEFGGEYRTEVHVYREPDGTYTIKPRPPIRMTAAL
jgi:hypothetical protein